MREHLGAATHYEQRVAECTRAGRQIARLDVAVTLPGATTTLLDVAVTDAYSTNVGRECGRSERPHAAEQMERQKRTKYGASDRLVPFVLEAHGRLGPCAAAWLKKAYKGESALRMELVQELSAIVQAHTAAMIMASVGV